MQNQSMDGTWLYVFAALTPVGRSMDEPITGTRKQLNKLSIAPFRT